MSKFTTQELDLASDPTVLLIKYRMMEKVWDFLEELQKDLKVGIRPFEKNLPEELNCRNGKISRGENYKYLPYMILDYPAYFSKIDIMAFRTMFYWGNFISSTLHLQGKFVKNFGNDLIEYFRDIEGIYFCVSDSPWQYDYKTNNYVPLNDLKANEVECHIEKADFIKLSIKFPVEEMPERKSDIINFISDGLKVIQTN
jgi:hypothetical protein